MLKSKLSQRENVRPAVRRGLWTTLALGLLLCTGATGLVIAQSPGPPPAVPTKEYIYAGGRLVAIEEPGAAAAGRRLVWQQQADGRVGEWRLNGLARIDAPSYDPGQMEDTNWRIVGTADFNQDGEPDLVWQHQSSGEVGVWLMDGLTRTAAPFFDPSQVEDTNWKIVGLR